MSNYFQIPATDLLLTNKCNMQCKYCFEDDKKSGCDLNDKTFKFIIDNNIVKLISPFGGEPLIKFPLLLNNYKYCNENKNIQDIHIKNYIITNGLLIEKHIKEIKENNFNLQISLDGIKESNHNRITKTNINSYDIVMNAIELCYKHKINWSIHGVILKDTIKYISRNYIFTFKLYQKYYGLKETIKRMDGNCFSIAFEEEYSDSDIDLFLNEYSKINNYINNVKDLTKENKNQLKKYLFSHISKICSAGMSFSALDGNLDIYPCHRYSLSKDFNKFKLGNIKNIKQFDLKTIKLYNTLFRLQRRNPIMYSNNNFQFKVSNNRTNLLYYYCPASNHFISNNPYFIPSKYSILIQKLSILLETFLNNKEESKND